MSKRVSIILKGVTIMLKRLPVVALAALAAISSAMAQEYPTKPVRVLVGYAAGSGTDFLARAVSDGLRKELGQPFVVENRPGAGGSLAAEQLAKSPGDGYTLAVTGGASFVINVFINPKPLYDTLRDFTPITRLVLNDAVLFVNKDVPVKNLPELIELIRKSPGKYTLGSSGGGTQTRLGVEELKRITGIQVADIFYPAGDAKGAMDVMGGFVQAYMAALVSVAGPLKSGQIKPIAAMGSQRFADFPDVPTAMESGFPNFTVQTWLGMMGPANMRKDVVDKLNRSARVAMAEPQLVRTLSSQGSNIATNSPEDFAQVIRNDLKKYGDMVPSLGLSQ